MDIYIYILYTSRTWGLVITVFVVREREHTVVACGGARGGARGGALRKYGGVWGEQEAALSRSAGGARYSRSLHKTSALAFRH